jgi:hypothetical protein
MPERPEAAKKAKYQESGTPPDETKRKVVHG